MFDAIVQILAAAGIFGVTALMFAENLFPPIPSELIMPLAGFAAARGEMDFTAVVLAGSAGAIAGAQLWYEIGRRVGEARLTRWAAAHGRWLTLEPKDVARASAVFRRFGAPAMCLGRLVPIVRTWISIPAGIAGLGRGTFLVWTSLGSTVFTFLLAYAGFRLDSHYDRVAGWLNPLTLAVLLIGTATYLFRVVAFGRRRRGPDH